MRQRWTARLVSALLARPAFCQDMGIPESEVQGEVPLDPLITPKQMQKLHKLIDADGNGKLSLDELLAFSTKTGTAIAMKDTWSILQEADTSGDGKLSLEEHLKDFSTDHGEDEKWKTHMDRQREIEKAKFKAADANKDGLLDETELPAIFFPWTHDGVMTVTAKNGLAKKDADENGVLWFEELFPHDTQPSDEDMRQDREQFEHLDMDHDGSIGVEEFKAWESGIFHTHESVRSLFRTADRNADGHVTAEELADSHEDIAAHDAVHHLSSWAEHHEL